MKKSQNLVANLFTTSTASYSVVCNKHISVEVPTK